MAKTTYKLVKKEPAPTTKEKAFRRVNVPKDAILFVVQPGEVFNPELESYLRSQGYELAPVKSEPGCGVQPSPKEAAAKIYGVLTSYDPISQNNIIAALLAEIRNDRLGAVKVAEQEAKQAAENFQLAMQINEVYLNVTEHGVNKSDGFKSI